MTCDSCKHENRSLSHCRVCGNVVCPFCWGGYGRCVSCEFDRDREIMEREKGRDLRAICGGCGERVEGTVRSRLGSLCAGCWEKRKGELAAP